MKRSLSPTLAVFAPAALGSLVLVLVWRSGEAFPYTDVPKLGTNGTAKAAAMSVHQTDASQPTRQSAERLPPNSTGLIRTLRDQILQSPVFEESGATEGLLESLDEAEQLFADAKRRNREALQRLDRSVLESRSGTLPNVVIVAFERLSPVRLISDSQPALLHLQALAQSGTVFSQAYAGSSDLDTSFWTLLTSRNTGRLPKGTGTTSRMDSAGAMMESLERADYLTACIGHWPVEPGAMDVGFDYWSGIPGPSSAVGLFPETLSLGRSGMRLPTNHNGGRGETLWKVLESELVSWLHARQTSDQPFLLLVRLPVVGGTLEATVSQETLLAWDGLLGRVVSAIDQTGQSSRTCLIATALASELSASTGKNGKNGNSDLAEAILRVPVVFSGPGMTTPGKSIDRPVALWDIFPSCLELARASRRPSGIDGVSFVSSGARPPAQSSRVLYWRSATNPADQAARQGRWKAIYLAKEDRLQLFNLENDPDESENVAGQHPDVVRQLLVGSPKAVDSTIKRASN